MEIGHAHNFQIQYHQYNMVQHEIGSKKQKKGNSMISPLYVRMEHSCVVRYGNVTQIVLFSWSQIFLLNRDYGFVVAVIVSLIHLMFWKDLQLE